MTKLYRSQRDKKIFGLCGGIAEVINVDATLLRIILVVTAFFSGGTVILLYIIAAIIIPKEPQYPISSNNRFTAYDTSYTSKDTGCSHTSTGYSHTPPMYANSSVPPKAAADPNLDEMMKDIERKALQKEIEELRAKVAKYEKGVE
jgi:phage shock protein PspC (stress-responsive transcriptional regulator)